jgi:hypothetical protein
VVVPGGHFSTGLSVGPGEIMGSGSFPASCPAAQGVPISSTRACMKGPGYQSFITYQPGYRFWPFQFIETGIFVALAAALIALTFLVILRKDA